MKQYLIGALIGAGITIGVVMVLKAMKKAKEMKEAEQKRLQDEAIATALKLYQQTLINPLSNTGGIKQPEQPVMMAN